jgi:hypothetical protein
MKSNIYGHGYSQLYKFGKDNNCLDKLANVFKANSLSKVVSNIATFNNKVNVENYEVGKPLSECSNKVKGDLWELFTIIWLEQNGGDKMYRILNVKWAGRDQIGYDFTGTDHNGNPAFIQSKFHANPMLKYESNQLETFLGESRDLDSSTTAVLFTSAVSISERYRRRHREGKLVVLDKKRISKFCDKGFFSYLDEKIEKGFS